MATLWAKGQALKLTSLGVIFSFDKEIRTD